MLSQVKKWGNSLGVRVPKKIAIQLGFKEGSNINIKVSNNKIIITSNISELDLLLNEINDQNCHSQIFDDSFVGKEIW